MYRRKKRHIERKMLQKGLTAKGIEINDEKT
jgi:hypothetical protein